MKIQNTNNHTYLLGTITEVCHTIGSIIERDWSDKKEFYFPKFYFGTVDEFERVDKPLHQVAIAIEGWYGCKQIESEFESSDIATILADYCGGGAAVARSLWLDDLYVGVVEDAISSLMIKSLEMNWIVGKDPIVLVETEFSLPIYSDEELAQLRTQYEKFKRQWMADHGYTLESLVASLAADLEDSGEPLWETYQTWEKETGFGSEIWPCFDEWLENEKSEHEKEENQ